MQGPLGLKLTAGARLSDKPFFVGVKRFWQVFSPPQKLGFTFNFPVTNIPSALSPKFPNRAAPA